MEVLRACNAELVLIIMISIQALIYAKFQNAYLVNPSVEELLEEFNVTNNSLQIEQKVETLLVRNVAERL